MKQNKVKSKVVLAGSQKEGWVITVLDNVDFCDDLAITHEELKMLKKLIDKKL